MNNNKEYRSVIWNRYKKREETRSEFPAPAEKSKEFLSKNFNLFKSKKSIETFQIN